MQYHCGYYKLEYLQEYAADIVTEATAHAVPAEYPHTVYFTQSLLQKKRHFVDALKLLRE